MLVLVYVRPRERADALTNRAQDAIRQIDDVIAVHKSIDRYSGEYYRGYPTPKGAATFVAASNACISRLTEPNSQYARLADSYTRLAEKAWHAPVEPLLGLLTSLRSDIEAGYIESLVTEVRTDLFGDFLESAEHLLNEGNTGYKDAAAVLAGGVLEQHLRELCEKHGIDTTKATSDGPRYKPAGDMNADLARANIYTKIYQNTITAWLNIRNDASHRRYDNYEKPQVALFIQGLRDFIARYPA